MSGAGGSPLGVSSISSARAMAVKVLVTDPMGRTV